MQILPALFDAISTGNANNSDSSVEKLLYCRVYRAYKKCESPQSIFGQFIKANTSAKYTILCQTPTIITMRSQVFSLYSSPTSPTFENIYESVFRAEETATRCSPSRQRSSGLALGCSTPDRSWAASGPPAARCRFRRRLRRRTWSRRRRC